MPAVIRQQYLDPLDKRPKTREVNVDIEIVRPDETLNVESVVQMRVDPIFAHHLPNQTPFETTFFTPEEAMFCLLDRKRTSNPPNCLRARLIQKSDSFTFMVDNIKSLKLNKNDPVVIMDTLEDDNVKLYGLVESFDNKSLTITSQQESMAFYKGAFVQNLSNRWNKDHGIDGVKTQLRRPSSPTFGATYLKETNQVEIIISTPLNIGNTERYDIYLRDHPFNEIKPHWCPDVEDISVETEVATVKTYNGGPSAGGGVLSKNKPITLYCGMVAKDNLGQVNVFESSISVQKLDLD